jgi:hypothetical protein
MEFTPEFFDQASKAWRANKVRVAEGCFRYKRNAFSKEAKPVVLEKKPVALETKPRRSPRFAVSK